MEHYLEKFQAVDKGTEKLISWEQIEEENNQPATDEETSLHVNSS